MVNHFTKHRNFSFVVILASLFYISCRKDLNTPDIISNQAPDFTAKVNSSVSGFVTDETNGAVAGASVMVGSTTIYTDRYGYFEIKNVDVVKTAGVVTVSKTGYFKGIKTYFATEDKAAFFRIKLIPKSNSGSISAATGGNITLPNGLGISLPANAVVNVSTNGIYSGDINVAAYWINPSASDLVQIMPGDLRGVDEAGLLKRLTTYGMAAVELTGATGELLQIAPGKKAKLTMPLPSTISANAPASIPLWYFDENAGLWKEEGSAIKTGNSYVGEVSHFSYWNCDVPNSYVQFNCTVVNSTGQPLPFAVVKISVVGDPNNAGWGYTDGAGYTAGAVPDNAQLLMEIFSNYDCGTATYSQNFVTTNTNISLGTITINTINSTANVAGTVTNCAGNAVSNGYILMIADNVYSRYPLTSSGTYNFSTLICTSPLSVTFVGEDLATNRQSAPLSYSLVAGNDVIGNLQACGLSSAEFFNYNVNGTNYSFSTPSDTLLHSNYGGNNTSHVGAFNTSSRYTYISFNDSGIGLNSVQNMVTFFSTDTPDSANIVTPVPVTITEYGVVGEFISGNFTGTFAGNPPANIPYNISGAFRVRRNF